MGEIAIQYGGESLRNSNVYEKVRRTTVARNLKNEEQGESPSLDKIIEEDAKDEAAYLTEKVEKLSAEIKTLMEENLKLKGQLKSQSEEVKEESKEVEVKKEEVLKAEEASKVDEIESQPEESKEDKSEEEAKEKGEQ